LQSKYLDLLTMAVPSKSNANATINEKLLMLLLGAFSVLMVVQSFSPTIISSRRQYFVAISTIKIHSATIFTSKLTSNVMLATKSSSGGDGKRKRKRKRKRAPQIDTTVAANTKTNADPTTTATTYIDNEVKVEVDLKEEEIDISTMKDVASFSFGGGGNTGNINDIDELSQTINQITVSSAATSSAEKQDGYIPLPDIKDTLRRKDLGSNKGRNEEEKDSSKKKIDRRDKKALLKLLEQDPYADADESFFRRTRVHDCQCLARRTG